MTGHRNVLLNLIEAVDVDELKRVLLTVNSSLLHCGEKLCECHRCGVRAESFPCCQMKGVLHDADLKS